MFIDLLTQLKSAVQEAGLNQLVQVQITPQPDLRCTQCESSCSSGCGSSCANGCGSACVAAGV